MLNCLVVRAPNALVPAPSRVMLTTHWVLFCWMPSFTAVIWVPSTVVSPSTYLLPLASQDTIWLVLSSHWSFASV